MIELVPVNAYFLSWGNIQLLSDGDRLAASDFAPKWEKWRTLAREKYGWEILIEPGGRAFFRTPQDQQNLVDEGFSAAPMDSSAHQAGRAVDVDLSGMTATYSNFNYDALVELAEQAGISNRVFKINGTEPWHFDDNPASLYGSTKAAIEAIGNTFNQVAAAVAAGLDTPQVQALKKNLLTWWPLAAGGAFLLFLWLTDERTTTLD